MAVKGPHVLPDNLRHGQAKRRGKILLGHGVPVFFRFEQINHALGQGCLITNGIKLDAQ
jgi:hypothetical protein